MRTTKVVRDFAQWLESLPQEEPLPTHPGIGELVNCPVNLWRGQLTAWRSSPAHQALADLFDARIAWSVPAKAEGVKPPCTPANCLRVMREAGYQV